MYQAFKLSDGIHADAGRVHAVCWISPLRMRMRLILHGSLLQQRKDDEEKYWRNYNQDPQK
jgi:hypothetical protein